AGETSLAPHGVLFLDELPEFHRRSLEVLRQPLEEGRVTISRALNSTTFPASFILMAAMNPCPCGYLGDPKRACKCSPPQIERYMARVSGPLLDRTWTKLHIPLHPPDAQRPRPTDTASPSPLEPRRSGGQHVRWFLSRRHGPMRRRPNASPRRVSLPWQKGSAPPPSG